MKGLKLKILGIEAGLRQYEVAAKVGIPATKLCEIEVGRCQPSPELLERILKVIKGNQAGEESRAIGT